MIVNSTFRIAKFYQTVIFLKLFIILDHDELKLELQQKTTELKNKTTELQNKTPECSICYEKI